jgi:hypothetical protein
MFIDHPDITKERIKLIGSRYTRITRFLNNHLIKSVNNSDAPTLIIKTTPKNFYGLKLELQQRGDELVIYPFPKTTKPLVIISKL